MIVVILRLPRLLYGRVALGNIRTLLALIVLGPLIPPQYRFGLMVGVALLGSPRSPQQTPHGLSLLYAFSYTMWWVILPGLLIEGVVYFLAWRRGVLGTAVLTVVVNAASAAAGMVYILVSLGFLASEDRSLMVGFLWASPLLIFAATVTAEYLTGTRLFKLPRSWKTVAIFTAANIPSVGLAIYGTLWLTAKEFAKGGY